jgi:hypothetical protein
MTRVNKKNAVDRLRLMCVLGALLASMTIGTLVLWVLEPHKMLKNTNAPYLAAVYHPESASKISRTAVPIENDLWQSVVIHTTRNRDPEDLGVRCTLNGKTVQTVAHFAIAPDGSTLIGTRWYNQEPAERFPGKILITIQLAEGRSDANLVQARELVNRIRELQALCSIPASKVFVQAQFAGKSCPNPLYRYNWRQSLLP